MQTAIAIGVRRMHISIVCEQRFNGGAVFRSFGGDLDWIGGGHSRWRWMGTRG